MSRERRIRLRGDLLASLEFVLPRAVLVRRLARLGLVVAAVVAVHREKCRFRRDRPVFSMNPYGTRIGPSTRWRTG